MYIGVTIVEGNNVIETDLVEGIRDHLWPFIGNEVVVGDIGHAKDSVLIVEAPCHKLVLQAVATFGTLVLQKGENLSNRP